MKVAAVALLLVLACALDAAAADPVHVSRAGKATSAVAGGAWTLQLAVRPASFHGAVRVKASGPGKLDVTAARSGGTYRARLVFPAAGRWSLTARAGGRTSRLGTVQMKPKPAQPVAFSEPTSIDLEPAGTLLLVENSPGRVLRVDPRTGRVTPLVPSVSRPYAAARTPAGDVLVSNGSRLSRIDAAGTLVTVAEADADVGPVAVSPGGDVYYAAGNQIFRLAGGAGPPARVAGTGVEGGAGDGGPALDAQLSNPHGLAVAADGSLLVADTGNGRVRRIDQAGRIAAFAQVGEPRGIDLAADGTIVVVEATAHRVVRLSGSGERIGFVGPVFVLPYDVAAADAGVTYLLEAGFSGRVRRIAADGTVTTVSRR